MTQNLDFKDTEKKFHQIQTLLLLIDPYSASLAFDSFLHTWPYFITLVITATFFLTLDKAMWSGYHCLWNETQECYAIIKMTVVPEQTVPMTCCQLTQEHWQHYRVTVKLAKKKLSHRRVFTGKKHDAQKTQTYVGYIWIENSSLGKGKQDELHKTGILQGNWRKNLTRKH